MVKCPALKALCSLLTIFVTLDIVSGEPAWFQVCDTKQKFTLNSVDCNTGLWLPRPIKAGCVCVNGVWVVSSDLCDKEFMLLVGSGDCFNIRKDIHSVKLLGEIEDPFAAASFVVSENFDSFAKVPHHGYNPSLGMDITYVITINPNRTLMRSDYDVCLRVKQRHLVKPVHVWRNARRVSDKFRFISDEKCQSPLTYEKHINFGEIYTEGEIVDAEGTIADCSQRCLVTPDMYKQLEAPKPKNVKSGRGLPFGKSGGIRISAGGRSARPPRPQAGRSVSASRAVQNAIEVLDKEGTTRINWEGLYSLNTKLKFINGDSLSEEDRQNRKNWYILRQNMTLFPMAHARETREQSVRMMQSHTSFLMLNQPSPKINTPEYDYFQKMRQIFMSEAPDDIIPHRVILGLMRMWRQLLWESHDKFAHRENPNPEQYGRVMTNLETCLVNVSKEPMVFSKEINVSDDKDPFWKMKPTSTHGCFDLTEIVYWNDSFQEPVKSADDPIIFYKTDLLISDDLRFDPNIHDLSIDLAYKMFLFTFYRCSEFFELRANDHSEMAEKVQSLFNYPIVKRWHESENFNDILPLVFPSLNITRFGIAMDRLVAAAKDASPWPEFLARPTLSITDPDLPKKASDMFRPKRSVRVPKKRSVQFWGSRAKCLNSFTDPVDMYGHKPGKGCYVNQPT